jgi:hypothetical protein
MNRKTALTVPYYLVRTPLTVFDKTVVRWLPERSGPRRAYEKTTAAIDSFAGRGTGGTSSGVVALRPATDLATRDTAASDLPAEAPASPPRPSTAGPAKAPAKRAAEKTTGAAAADDSAPAKKVAPKQVAAKKAAAKKAARKAAPKPETRANRSLSRIALDLAETEAIAEARETQAEQRVDAELSGDTGNSAPEDNS